MWKLTAATLAFVAAVPSTFGSGTGDGSDSANACPGSCTTDGNVKSCTFTTKLNIHASSTGYYQFEECGTTVQPVLEMEQGVEYTFLQNDDSNWLHPLGFAYLPDGAHEGVDELEAGISQSEGSCVDDNTCQAPMYYFDDSFYGSVETPAYPTAGNPGNFGLDDYEPKFQNARGDWMAERDGGSGKKWNIRLTITDTQYTEDIFYFCHIHNKMSGRIKVLNSAQEQINSNDTPALYSHVTPSNFDSGCGTFGLGQYNNAVCPPLASNKFVCSADNHSDISKNFDECLHAMDCAMHTEMRVYSDGSNPLATFMHQMIPHHHNAVNMAKAALKKVSLTTANDPEGELADLFWTIINEQNMQITFMEGWLAGENKVDYNTAKCPDPASVTTTSTTTTTTTTSATSNTTGSSSGDDDDDNNERAYLIWAVVTTTLLVASWVFFYVTTKSQPSSSKGKESATNPTSW